MLSILVSFFYHFWNGQDYSGVFPMAENENSSVSEKLSSRNSSVLPLKFSQNSSDFTIFLKKFQGNWRFLMGFKFTLKKCVKHRFSRLKSNITTKKSSPGVKIVKIPLFSQFPLKIPLYLGY